MTEPTDAELLADMSNELGKASADNSLRLCSQCYMAVCRTTYNDHMRVAHGFDVLEVTAYKEKVDE